jgi:hypothetical protein
MSLTRRRLCVRATTAVRITNYPSLPEFPGPYPSGYPQKSPQCFANTPLGRAAPVAPEPRRGITGRPAAPWRDVGPTCARSAVSCRPASPAALSLSERGGLTQARDAEPDISGNATTANTLKTQFVSVPRYHPWATYRALDPRHGILSHRTSQADPQPDGTTCPAAP